MNQSTFKILASASLLANALLIQGCTPLQIMVPANSTTGTQLLKVKDRSQLLANKDFTVGDYKISHIDRDWTTTKTTGIFSFSNAERKDGYQYRVSRQTLSLQGQCTAVAEGNNVELGSGWSMGSAQAALSCQCGEQAKLAIKSSDYGDLDSDNNGEEKVTFMLKEKNADNASLNPLKQYRGEVVIGSHQYAINSLHKTQGSKERTQPAGYRVIGHKSTVGMVEVLNPGQIWLKQNLSQSDKDHMTCLLTGLILYLPSDLEMNQNP